MSAPHERYRDDVAALLLGVLTPLERQALESHMEGCVECRELAARLRPAVTALARSVDQLEPPESLKDALMRVVEREADGRGATAARPARRRFGASTGARLRLGPALAGAAVALVIGAAAGFGIAQLGEEEDRTLSAQVDTERAPQASGSLALEGEGEDGAILRVEGLPELRPGQVYQAWVIDGKEARPQPTFEVPAGQQGAAAVPADLSGADAVAITREPRGGSPAPTEVPFLQVVL